MKTRVEDLASIESEFIYIPSHARLNRGNNPPLIDGHELTGFASLSPDYRAAEREPPPGKGIEMEGHTNPPEKAVKFEDQWFLPEPFGTQTEDHPPTPVGRLNQHIHMWEKAITATNAPCSFTLSVIRHGYRLEWAKQNQPPKLDDIFRREKNHPSTAEHAKFVTEAIAEGVRSGTMRETTNENLYCVMALGVAIHSRTKKKRLIFDGRHLNKFLRKTKIKSLHVEGRALFENCAAGGDGRHFISLPPHQLIRIISIICGIQLRGSILPFHRLTIWSLHSPPSLYKDHENMYTVHATDPGAGLRYLSR